MAVIAVYEWLNKQVKANFLESYIIKYYINVSKNLDNFLYNLQQVYVHPRMPFPGCPAPCVPTCHAFYQL
jgi:hypothetical protein